MREALWVLLDSGFSEGRRLWSSRSIRYLKAKAEMPKGGPGRPA